MPTWQKAIWVMGCLMVFWILEGSIPLFKFEYRKWKHAGIKLVFLGTSFVINAIFGIVTVGVFAWIHEAEIGLLYLFELPIWLELLIAVMILDFFAQFGIHYLLHKVRWMWKFHMVHHSDVKVDATTGTRHHPGDYVLREVASLVAVIVAGAPIAYYLFYRIVTIFFAYFTHANVTVPVWLDRPMSLVFVTPNMHKFHHHQKRPWTDMNFGNIFSIWDRAFGTLVYDDPKKVDYGLDVLDNSRDEDLGYQFKIPFDKSIKRDTEL